MSEFEPDDDPYFEDEYPEYDDYSEGDWDGAKDYVSSLYPTIYIPLPGGDGKVLQNGDTLTVVWSHRITLT